MKRYRHLKSGIGALFITALFFAGTMAASAQRQSMSYNVDGLASNSESRSINCDLPDFPFNRRSVVFLTAHGEWKGLRSHADGTTFHFCVLFDGQSHLVELIGLAEIKFMDGGYYRDPDWRATCSWSGEPGTIWGMCTKVSLYWPDRKIDYIHWDLDYYEDGQYIRNIDRTFYGNW